MEFDIIKSLTWIWNHIWEALKQMGGAAIVAAVCGFIVHKIDVHYEKRISAKYDLQLENLKMRLDTLSHIKNSQFDTQYAFYQELCECFFSMVSELHWLFPKGLDLAPAAVPNAKNLYADRYKAAQDKYNKAIQVLGAKAPFIDKDIYEKFKELQELSKTQLNAFLFANPLNDDGKNQEITKMSMKGYERTETIETKWNELLDSLRIYISDLGKEKQ